MKNSYCLKIMTILSFMLLVWGGFAIGGDQSTMTSAAENNLEFLESQGLGDIDALQAKVDNSLASGQRGLIDSLMDDVLLIPNSAADNIGMYDPETGDFLGLYITGFAQFQTPLCAIVGPDSNIYVSDQVADAVFVFGTDGNYRFTYADASDGLNNIRGIAFRDRHLFVTSGDDYVAEFDGPHNRLPNFIQDGSDPFDILFLDDGRALLANIQGTTDDIRLYSADGSFAGSIISVDFPEQIQFDDPDEMTFQTQAFSDNMVANFKLDGTITRTTPWSNGRGIYHLRNGNYLVTNGNGVFEIEPGTGAVIDQKNSDASRFIEYYTSGGQVGIGENMPKAPRGFSLVQNYPNPFNAYTTIGYNLSEAGMVVIDVYNLLGDRIETLVNNEQTAGNHQVIWQAKEISSGVYFYKIQAGNGTETKKMLLLK